MYKTIKPNGKKTLYRVEVYGYATYKGNRYKETAENTLKWGNSIAQVKNDTRKRYGSKWIIKVTKA